MKTGIAAKYSPEERRTMKVYQAGVWLAVFVCAWILLNGLMSHFLDGILYKVLTPMPVLDQSDEYVDFHCWYWTRFRMTISNAKLLECDGHVTGFASNEAQLPGGVVETEWRWLIPPAASGSCILRGTVIYRPFGPLGAEMTTAWESDPFILP